jgi:cyclic beta-1,2-glucan synthetase
MAADIYSNPQHPGRGGWTWYTGSASWAYKTGIENILGLCKEGDTLTLAPHVPTDWYSFTIRYRYGNSLYVIKYEHNNQPQAANQQLELVDDGQVHEVIIH